MVIGCSGRDSLGKVGSGHAWFGTIILRVTLEETLVRVAMHSHVQFQGETNVLHLSLSVRFDPCVRVHPPGR